MTVARRPRRRKPIHNRPLAEGELPTLVQLECFSEASLRQWQAAAGNLTELQTALFFGLELERQRHSEALIDAAAGAHAILYSSVRQEGSVCLALFPQNWARTCSFVEVMDGAPSRARLIRIDGRTREFQ